MWSPLPPGPLLFANAPPERQISFTAMNSGVTPPSSMSLATTACPESRLDCLDIGFFHNILPALFRSDDPNQPDTHEPVDPIHKS
jgi:hypothetical protein